MAKAYKFTASAIPERRTQSLYSDIITDFIAAGRRVQCRSPSRG